MKERILKEIQKILKEIKKISKDENLQEQGKYFGKVFGFSIGAILFIVILTNVLYQEKTVLKRGYTIEITENTKAKTRTISGISIGSLPDLSGASSVDIVAMIKKADIKKGEKIFKKCAACHTVQRGAPNKIGPNLYGIIGKKKTSVVGFKYSDVLKAKGGRWSYKELNKFLLKPSNYAKGTKMTFAGLKKDKDRANVIAYLESVR